VQHVGHHAHRLLGWLGGIAAILILVVVAGIWRLLQGPIELDRLIPYVEQALERSGAGIGVAVAGISVAIDTQTHQLDLQARDVRVTLPNGEKLASFPQMATSLSLAALLGGRIEPTRLVVEHPVLALTRDASGALSFRIGSSDAAADPPGLGDAQAIFTPLEPGTPWSRLRRIDVRDATILVDDAASGKVWRASRAAATLERSTDGVTGDLSVAVALGDKTPELHATYRIQAPARQIDVGLAVDGLDPAGLATLSPALAPLAQARFPVYGTADLRFNLATGKSEGGRLDLNFGAGQIATDLLASGSLPIARGELHADYAPEAARLRLEQLAFDLRGGTTLAVDGRLDGLSPQLVSTGVSVPAALHGALGVTVKHVPTSRLAALWPRGVSPGGRKWIAANLADGVLDELKADLGVTIDPQAMTADFTGAHATMRYHDLTVDYFAGLPPIKKVSGTATLTDRRLDFAITGGVLKSLKVNSGTLSITNIGPGTETLTVDVGIAGPLQDVIETIDAKPLHYAHESGIDPARVGGKADAQLHFQFPLLAALKLSNVDYGAKAVLSGVSYSQVAFDHPMTDGNFTLELGHDGVHAKGSGKYDGSPATIDGNLYFHAKAGPRLVYRIGLALDDTARDRLGWDVGGDRLAGPITVNATYTVPAAGKRSEVRAVLDLGSASLACSEANWKKPPGVPANAKLLVALKDDTVIGIPQIDIKAPGLDGRFAVGLSPDGHRLERIDIHRLIIGDNDLAGMIKPRPTGGWEAEIRAGRLNLHHLLKHALESDNPGNPTPLAIDAHIGRLLLGPHREARNVSASLLRDRGEWQSMRIDAGYTNGHHLTLALGGPEGSRKLRLQSDDMGAAFALFGIADNVAGGRVAVDGTVSEVAGHHIIRARIEGDDYHLVRAPALAQLLSLTSFDAIASLMSGTGIPFSTLRGDVSFSRGVIALRRVVAYGGALGISAQGWLNPGEDRIAIDGTLGPAYALNSVLGSVPVIGSILTGGEGQGLIATRFQLTGSNDNPTVTVNPLSALTPGLLRHLFDPFNSADALPDASGNLTR